MQTHTKQGARDSQAKAATRGLTAVVVLLLTGIDALITARLGIPRLAWLSRRIARELADEYRRGKHDAVDAEVIDEEIE